MQTAAVNPGDKFELVFRSLLETLFVERMDQNEEIFVRFMNDAPFRKLVTEWLVSEAYKRLRGDDGSASGFREGDVGAHHAEGSIGLPARIIPLDDARVACERFKTLLPVYSLRAAAGYFGGGEAVEPEGWVEATGVGHLDDGMFVARAVGQSMEPKIQDGDLVVFRRDPAGTRQGKIVLAQYRGPADPETGGSFTVKKYSSEKRPDADTDWRHTLIVLSPLNREYEPIVVPEQWADDFRILAEFVAVLGR